MPDSRRISTPLTVVLALLAATAGSADGADPSVELAETVRQAALATYVHGMTDEIASRVDDQDAIELLRLLDTQRFAGRGDPPESSSWAGPCSRRATGPGS